MSSLQASGLQNNPVQADLPMKPKLRLRSLSPGAARVAIRTQLPWPLRLAFGFVALLLGAAALIGVYQYARATGAPDLGALQSEVETLRQQLRESETQRERSAALAVQAESQLNVERAMQQQITQQIKTLEDDTARLKGDLSFFESLLPTPAGARGVVIRSFRLQPEGDDSASRSAMRYRLLVQQSGRPERDFVGAVVLKVNLQRGDSTEVLQLPHAAQPAAGPAPLAFRHYQRVEGTFAVPAGATVRSVEVLISAGGETRAQQTFPAG